MKDHSIHDNWVCFSTLCLQVILVSLIRLVILIRLVRLARLIRLVSQLRQVRQVRLRQVEQVLRVSQVKQVRQFRIVRQLRKGRQLRQLRQVRQVRQLRQVIQLRQLRQVRHETTFKSMTTKTAILNLGYVYPQGYASRLQGLHTILNLLKISPFQSLIYVRPDTYGGTRSARILFRGYAKE